MSKFKHMADVVSYPSVQFYPKPYYVSFSLDYNATPLIPHVCMLVHPYVAPGKQPSGADEHYHIPFTLRDAKRLRDWLTTYINDREGILR